MRSAEPSDRPEELRRPLGPSPNDRDVLMATFRAVDRGELLDVETSAAYLRWLETGEGPCPWPDES